MIETNDAWISGLVEAAQHCAGEMLKHKGGLAPFAVIGKADQQVDQMEPETSAQVAASADYGLLLEAECRLNLAVRERSTKEAPAVVALATRRETNDGICMVLQIEFSNQILVMLFPLKKRMLAGWTIGEPQPVGQRIFPGAFDGTRFPAPAPGVLKNAFAPAAAGDALFHRPSGFRFPMRAGNFNMVSASQGDPGGADVTVGYDEGSSSARLVVTAFVYPRTGEALDAHFSRAQADVMAVCPAARLLFADRAELSAGRIGKVAAFRLKGPMGGEEVDAFSELWLFALGSEWLKFRATYEPAWRTTAPATVRGLVDGLAWPASAAARPAR